MTDQELITLFYEDIKNSVELSWFDNLCNLDVASYQEFFNTLPEPIRSYAFAETDHNIDKQTTLKDVFDDGFTWADARHGKIWDHLFHIIHSKRHGVHVDPPNVNDLLSL